MTLVIGIEKGDGAGILRGLESKQCIAGAIMSVACNLHEPDIALTTTCYHTPAPPRRGLPKLRTMGIVLSDCAESDAAPRVPQHPSMSIYTRKLGNSSRGKPEHKGIVFRNDTPTKPATNTE